MRLISLARADLVLGVKGTSTYIEKREKMVVVGHHFSAVQLEESVRISLFPSTCLPKLRRAS